MRACGDVLTEIQTVSNVHTIYPPKPFSTSWLLYFHRHNICLIVYMSPIEKCSDVILFNVKLNPV